MAEQGQVGPQVLTNGSVSNIRLDRTGSLAVVQSAGFYTENCKQGNIFIMDSDSVTLAAANATKAAMATAKFIIGFFNPANSGKNAAILKAHIATVSGTPGGPYFWNFISNLNMTNAVTGTIRNALLGGAASAMQAATGVILTATGGPTTALTQLAVMGGPAAVAAGAGIYDAFEEVAGHIIVPPGTLFGLTCLAAGTTHVVQSTLVWEEFAV